MILTSLVAHLGLEPRQRQPYSRSCKCTLCYEDKRESSIEWTSSLKLAQILKGSLTETIYEAPEPGKTCPPTMKRARVYAENEVTYMSDKIGIHKISNTGKDTAVSLHL